MRRILSLLKAETEEERKKIDEMEAPEMSRVIDAYYTITTSSEFREKERLRANACRDEALVPPGELTGGGMACPGRRASWVFRVICLWKFFCQLLDNVPANRYDRFQQEEY